MKINTVTGLLVVFLVYLWYSETMISRIFTTSWQHISRTKAASLAIVVILTGLFLTFFIGFFLIQQAEVQRQLIVKKFNYPLFINTSYSLIDPKI